MDQKLADTAGYTLGRSCICTRQMASLFCVKWRHDCHLERMTFCQKPEAVNRSVLLKNNPDKFHPDPTWNDRTLGSFEQRRPSKKWRPGEWEQIIMGVWGLCPSGLGLGKAPGGRSGVKPPWSWKHFEMLSCYIAYNSGFTLAYFTSFLITL